MCEREAKASRLSVTLQFFAIGLPLAYLTGYLYQQGYLSAYGFSSDAFFYAPEYYLVYFFIAVSMSFMWGLEKVLNNWQIFLFSFVLLLLIAFIAANFEENISCFHSRMKEKVRESTKKPSFLRYFLPVIFATMMTSVIYTMFLILGLMVLIGYTGFYVGKKVAQDEIKGFSCEKSTNCQRLFINGELKGVGYVIAISEKFIAFRTVNETMMLLNENIELKGNIAAN